MTEDGGGDRMVKNAFTSFSRHSVIHVNKCFGVLYIYRGRFMIKKDDENFILKKEEKWSKKM